jgi:hypothetical protein
MTIRARVSVKQIDRGLERLRTLLKSIGQEKTTVKAGVVGSKAEDARGVMTNARLAAIHEYGSPAQGIPARPFVSSSFAAHRGEYISLLSDLVAHRVLTGKMEYKTALGLVGAKMAADMKARVVGGPPLEPPLAPATLRRKARAGLLEFRRREARAAKTGRPAKPVGDPRPLVDTGRMVGAISWELGKRGEP